MRPWWPATCPVRLLTEFRAATFGIGFGSALPTIGMSVVFVPARAVPPSAFETTGARIEDIVFGNGISVNLFALAGAFENASTGCVDMSMGISKEGLVIGDEIWAHTRRLLEGFCDEPDAFGLTAIKRVSTDSGHYLTDDHTRDFLRKETQFVPNLFAYRSHDAWSQNPKTLAQEARERANDILARHEVPPLEESLEKELDRIEAAAQRAIA